jgi:mannose-6-phosphate isomerase-like protein (cupin superfamily)
MSADLIGTEGRLRPVITSATATSEIRPFGIEMRVLAKTADTGGRFSALLVVHQPGEGPPPHMHDEQAEVFFVIEGEYTLTVDGVVHRAGPDTLVFLPPLCVHGFKNTGSTPAKMLDCSIPGGQDHMFQELHEISKGANPAQLGFKEEIMQKTAVVNKKHRTTYFIK